MDDGCDVIDYLLSSGRFDGTLFVTFSCRSGGSDLEVEQKEKLVD
jgi:hypothetical protein